MINIYCSKCGGVVPGLDKNEFLEFNAVYTKCVMSVKQYRERKGTSLEETPLEELYFPAIEKYEELTGFKGKDAFHLYRKHNKSNFKLYCSDCNLYYLAPTTGKCPECGSV